jgi:hypothetical protein
MFFSVSIHYSVGSGFNRMIELNQKMLILKRFVTKNDFLCDMTTELFIKYFCSIKLCCLWVRPLPPIEPLSPLCVPSMLPCVEVSSPKTINIKQYLNTNNFSSNLHKQQGMSSKMKEIEILNISCRVRF